MAIKYTPVADRQVTHIVCPVCHDRIRGVFLEKGSRVDGLVIKCKRCGSAHAVKTDTSDK